MRREALIPPLEESVANNLAFAAELELGAQRQRRVNSHTTAAEFEKRAQHWRWSAGCCMAAINHLNRVSPE